MASWKKRTDVQAEKNVAWWLFACCVMVFFMVVLGGLTRLTHSGLSMVEWQPLVGVLPPLSEAEWQATFARYQQFPEYQKINLGMTLEGFKGIFWLEYIHRLWGRLIGVVFLLPFLWFAACGHIRRPMVPKLLLIFGLGAGQGVMGWLMVQSGLIDHPHVSQYRLTIHLALAFLIIAVMLWVGLDILRANRRTGQFILPELPLDGETRAVQNALGLALALITVTVLAGGFVAGLKAGLIYNTFPLMDGALIPAGLFPERPWYLNMFEDVKTVQFMHRMWALLTLAAVVRAWWLARRAAAGIGVSPVCHAMLAMALLQVALGIATLLLVVPVSIATLHQAGAVVLLVLTLWALHESITA